MRFAIVNRPLPTTKMNWIKGKIKELGHEISKNPELVLSIGGDGTMLEAYSKFSNKPILGLHAGQLGFLTQYNLDELELALIDYEKGKCKVEEVMTLDVFMGSKKRGNALNDVVVTRTSRAKALRVDVSIDRVDVSKLVGDGVIVSTPTGSTGYNMSAGGAVIEAGVPCLQITPVCTHLKKGSPLIVTPNRKVTIRAKGASVIIDGLKEFKANTVSVKASRHKAKLVKRKSDLTKISGIFT